MNTYALFAEHNLDECSDQRGRAGFVVPSGIATDDTTKDYFQAIMQSGALQSMWEFENEGFFTAGKGHMLRFALTTLSGENDPSTATDFMYPGTVDLGRSMNLNATSRLVPPISTTINPNTGTCPIFRAKRDAGIVLGDLPARTGILWNESDPDGNPWGLRFLQHVSHG